MFRISDTFAANYDHTQFIDYFTQLCTYDIQFILKKYLLLGIERLTKFLQRGKSKFEYLLEETPTYSV